MSATPVSSGGTEPPSRHLACARLPISALRCRSVSSKLFDSPEPHSPRGPLADWASVRLVPHLTVSRSDTTLTLEFLRTRLIIQCQLFLAAYLPAPGPQLSKEAFQLRALVTLMISARFLGLRQGQALRFDSSGSLWLRSELCSHELPCPVGPCSRLSRGLNSPAFLV